MQRRFSPEREARLLPGRLVACITALLLVASCTAPGASEAEIERLTRERDALQTAAVQAHEKARAADLVAQIRAHDAAAITDPAERAAAEERARLAAADAATARAEEDAAYEAVGAAQAELEEMQSD